MQAKLNRPCCSTMLKIAASLCVLGPITSEAAAQRPTKAQENAIRSACLRDYMSHCSKVKPGAAGLACLQKNSASLSAGCRTALSGISGGSAPAAGPQTAARPAAAPTQPAAQRPTKAQESAIRSACLKDYMSHCSKVKPGAAGLACLQKNSASLSAGCRTALSGISGGSAPAADAQAAVPTQPADRPTTAQENALSSACSNDFVAHCSKVKPGSPAALACLQRNSASLSAKCQTALRVIGGGPAPAAGAEPAALPAPAPMQDNDVALVEAVSGRVIVFARGKPALLEKSDMISAQAQLDLEANSELRFCHFKANRLLILKGPARVMVSGSGVTDERGNPISAAVETCSPPVR
jgi:Cysteine rich repeat